VALVSTPGRVAACALALGSALAAGSALASATPPRPRFASPALWATIDVCNTKAHHATIGIRGSMPGTGDAGESMFMQFRVEYLRRRVWTNIGSSGTSFFEEVGDAGAGSRQAGLDFTLASKAGHHYLLRGVVTFQWRLGGHTVAATLRSTTAGHRAGAGADPPGYSASVCSIAAKRRGSFVITPVTPSAARRAIRDASLTVQA
jgi:hypothetical protein